MLIIVSISLSISLYLSPSLSIYTYIHTYRHIYWLSSEGNHDAEIGSRPVDHRVAELPPKGMNAPRVKVPIPKHANKQTSKPTYMNACIDPPSTASSTRPHDPESART